MAMQVRVLFFGALKDVVGRAEERLQVETGSSIGDLYARYAERFPALEKHRASMLFSRNREFVNLGQSLEEGDEVGFLPPVSGGVPGGVEVLPKAGEEHWVCRLTRSPIDARTLVNELLQGEDGAVVVFEGVVRNHSQGRATRYLEYDAYEPMALEKMRAIASDLTREYPIGRIAMVHRLGRLEIGESSVVIVVSSEHRKAAFEASRVAIDRLKKTVPIWKKEYFADGEIWVEGEGSSAATAQP